VLSLREEMTMKTLAMTLALLAGLPLALAAQVSKEDIKKLCSAGISDEVILGYVKANGPVAKLSAEDVIELKQAGASEKLLSVILGAPAGAPAPERGGEKQVVTRPATNTVVVDSPYYTTPTSYYYDSYPYYSYYYPYYYPSYYYSPYYYPRYYSYYYPSFGVGFSTGRWCTTRGFSHGVSTYRR
jgi:hypothetical protein